MKAKGTAVYTRQRFAGPTLAQQSAIDLLVTGKSDTETAAALGLSRTAVTKWRLYDLAFQAALNRRRAEVWGAGADKLRALIPQALDVLAAELAGEGPGRVKAALAVLRLAPTPELGKVGSADPDTLLDAIVAAKRDNTRSILEDVFAINDGRPTFDQHAQQVRDELAAKLAEPDDGITDLPTLLPAAGPADTE